MNTSSKAHSLSHNPDNVRRPFRWPKLLTKDGSGLAFGGDYNPDQWPESVWDEDIELMQRAHVNTVALGIFSWAKLEPQEGVWDFEWLDRIIDKLGRASIAVDLASSTANAPLWLYQQHPEVLPQDEFGHVINPGSRQAWRPTSPVFKQYALETCRQLAQRYGDNPYVTAWHMGNEYGWNNFADYSDDAQRAFQAWLEQKYGTIEQLNSAWNSAFWSHQMNSFDQALLPRHFGFDNSQMNPPQGLDYLRFCSDTLKDFYCAERDAIEQICPDKPFTTNFMVSTDQALMDYADWSDEVDFVSNDHYFSAGTHHLDELLCSDSLVDSFALHQPWYLMENSTSAVNWRPVNPRKRQGELVRDGLAHVAMGADAINFFQWRQSFSGAEAFHSSMLPHAGADTTVFREVCQLGELLAQLGQAGLQGSQLKRSETAILFDNESQWFTGSGSLPTGELDHWHTARDWYYAFLDAGQPADVVALREEWEELGYKTLILPSLIVLSETQAERVRAFAQAGGTVVVDYASGLVDENAHVGLGGYPAKLRELVGLRSAEFNILGAVEGEPDHVHLSNGWTAKLWANVVDSVAPTAQVLATYQGAEAEDWELAGLPALTKNAYGQGSAFYLGCDLGQADLTEFVTQVLGIHGAYGIDGDEAGVVSFTRQSAAGEFEFVFNRAKTDATVAVTAAGAALVTAATSAAAGVVTVSTGQQPLLTYRAEVRDGVLTLHRSGVAVFKR